MMDNRNQQIGAQALEQIFAEARAEAPLPPADLLARIEADAARVQPGPGAVAGPQSAAAPGAAVGQRLMAWLGQWVMPAGLASAALAGLWIGISAQGLLSSYGALAFESDMGLQLMYDFPALAGLLPEG